VSETPSTRADAGREAPRDGSKELSAGKQLGFAVVLLGLVLLVGGALIEIGLRLYGFKAPGFYDANGNGVSPNNKTGAHGGPFPPGPGRLVNFDYDVPYVVNSHGFREREPIPKAPGEWRIGLLGDSHTAGWGVSIEERFGERWIAARRERQAEARLWNFGAPSTGTYHMADVLAGIGASYELDELLLAISGANELADNVRWEKWRGHEPRAPGATPRRSATAVWIRDHSRLAMLLWFHVAHGLFAESASAPQEPPDYFEKAWPSTEAALDRFLAVAAGRPLQIWYLPPTPEWSDDAFARSAGDPAHRHRLRDHVRAWAAGHGVSFVDATEVLRGRPQEEVVFEIDDHYHAGGHRLVAEAAIAKMQVP
jgi:hypothetical protein